MFLTKNKDKFLKIQKNNKLSIKLLCVINTPHFDLFCFGVGAAYPCGGSCKNTTPVFPAYRKRKKGT